MKRTGKGTFGPWQLPIATDYIRLRRQDRLLAWGGILALLVGALIALSFFYFDEAALSAGAISSAHAFVEDDCASCHGRGTAVRDELCGNCHEKVGKRELYSFAQHYVYRSNPPGETRTRALEVDCADCHNEHRGRSRALTEVTDGRCLSCHPFGGFHLDHPPFDSSELAEEEPGLKFSHIFHTIKVASEYQLSDFGEACLYCHAPDPQGKHFEELSFDLHCASCHLKPPIQVGPLPVVDSSTGNRNALLSLEGFRNLETPPLWSTVADPGEFTRPSPGMIVKSILTHRDRWILANLARIATPAGTESGAGAHTRAELETLYRRALDDLRDYASGLSKLPERELLSRLSRIQNQLSAIDREVAVGEGAQREEDAAPQPLAQEQQALAEAVAKPCTLCHTLRGATLAPVSSRQRVLLRAEFDHRSHLPAAACVECHDRIPFAEALAEIPIRSRLELIQKLRIRGIPYQAFVQALEGTPDEIFSDAQAANIGQLLSTWSRETEVDRASVENLPRIEKCRECHRPEAASADCVNCHYFHPEKSLFPGSSFTLR